jgi:hypothetical protein
MYFHSAFIVLKDVLQKFAPFPYNWGNPMASTSRGSKKLCNSFRVYPISSDQMAGGCQNPSCKTTEFGAICIYLSLPLSERLARGLLRVSVGYSPGAYKNFYLFRNYDDKSGNLFNVGYNTVCATA